MVELWNPTHGAKYELVKYSKIDKLLLESYEPPDKCEEKEGEETNTGEVSIHDYTPSFLDWMLLINFISFNV